MNYINNWRLSKLM